MLFVALSLAAGCKDERRPYYPECSRLTCPEGEACQDLTGVVPTCVSNPAQTLVRIALPASFIPLPTTGDPVEGTTLESDLFHASSVYFDFEATGQHLYQLTGTCRDMSGCSVFVADAEGLSFHEASSHGSNGVEQFDVRFRPVRAGRYIIALAPHSGESAGHYSLQLQPLPDDHGDLAESATPISGDDATFEGVLQATSDRDVFAFHAEAGQRLVVACTQEGGGGAYLQRTVSSASGELLMEGAQVDSTYLTAESGPHLITLSTPSLEDGPFNLQYRCRLRNVTDDDHGDTAAEATPLGTSALEEGWFQAPDDVDVFQAELSPKAYYLLGCEAPAGRQCTVRVVAPSGAVLQQFTTSDPAVYVPTEAGVHSVELRGSGVHDYRLRFNLGDVDEHGDTPEQATPIQAGSVLQGEFHGPGDVDVFAFDALVAHGYRFTCTSRAGAAYPLALVMRSADGAVVSSPPNHTPAEMLASAAGRYTVQVQGLTRALAPHPYSCTLEDRGPDVHGDILAQATPITLPVKLGGRVETSQDADVFSFTAEAGQFILARLGVPPSDALRDEVRLLDASGQVLASARTPSALISHRLATSGTFFLEVRGAANDFTFEAENLGFDDHGDTLETATPLTQGVTVSGRGQGTQDRDVFSLPAEPGRFYRFVCVPEVGNNIGLCNVTLLNGHRMGWDVKSPLPHDFIFDVSASGTVGLAIDGLETYTIRLEEVVLDDHSWQAAQATPLTLGSAMAGVFEAAIDEDVFVVTLQQGVEYRLRLDTTFTIRYSAVDALTGLPVPSPLGTTLRPQTTGPVLIRVLPAALDGSLRLGPYELRVDSL
ncbi:hypothetical protein [Pyxidicoccus sp. MSG2]|uniref:hypothetical protein n=1 Tax=Pyxidicoccus sp. MSG2 TaxID=2996790 RepID=UPI00226E173C|nr:hypothetical protein [Pyxidicoccus sp. MSG2]MCY1022478.1 hypothetical protein [Pyxidicoccus sp. MSG2]